MTPTEIKIRLKEKNLSQSALARRWGVAVCTVNALVHRKIKSERLERRLARVLKPSNKSLHCLLCHRLSPELSSIPGFDSAKACPACIEVLKRAVRRL